MVSSSTLVTKIQKYQHRLLQVLLFATLVRNRAGLKPPRWYFPWLSREATGILGLVLVLELTRSVCRTPYESARFLVQIFWRICSIFVQYAARGFKPKFPKWTLRFELVRGIMRDTADMFGERIVDVTQAPIFRWHSELFGSFLGWFERKRFGLSLESVVFNGLEHLWLKTSSTTSQDGRKRLVVLFYHGGGYAVLSPRMYIPFCSNLLIAIKQELASELTDEDVVMDIFLANYRKVPEHRFPAPAENTVAMYEFLLQHENLDGSQIILVGDSAGGGLVMSTLLRVRDGKSSWKSKLPLPLAAIVACPLADLTGDDDKSKGQHCVLSPSIISTSVESYHPTRGDPSVWADSSPVHCNLRGLPPVLLQAANFDYLFDHSLR